MFESPAARPEYIIIESVEMLCTIILYRLFPLRPDTGNT
jgi:hypothetical protein